jgi:hypothetical protein
VQEFADIVPRIVANPLNRVVEELTFRGRVAEMCEAIWSVNKDWIPGRIFKASNYSAPVTDPKEWTYRSCSRVRGQAKSLRSDHALEWRRR